VGAWFGSALTSIVFASLFLVYISTEKQVLPPTQNFKLYAALPEKASEVSGEIIIADGRSKMVEDFFERYHSILANYSQNFIAVADQYKLDWRLLPSIAMQESNGAKKVIGSSFNPFGYGIYGGLVIKFASWEEAIERVGRALREDYLDKGLTTPSQIMTKYTPPSLEKGGSWAIGVSSFMEGLR